MLDATQVETRPLRTRAQEIDRCAIDLEHPAERQPTYTIMIEVSKVSLFLARKISV